MQRSRSQATLSENLKQVLLKKDNTPVSVADILSAVGDKGFGLLLVILSLPSALPIPAPGYSTPFGIIIALLGLQLIAGKREPVLPKRALKLSLKYSSAEKMLTKASWFFKKIEPFIHPRLRWLRSRGGEALMGALVTIMACIMILPIPLTNTAPAMVIFLVGCGLSEDDGLFVLGACILAIFAACLYAVVLYFFVLYGVEGVFYLKDKVLELLSLLLQHK